MNTKIIHLTLCFLIVLQAKSQIISTDPGSGFEPNIIPTKQKATQFPAGDAFKNANITYQLIPGTNNTWGYNILVNKRIMIKQPTPPSLPGNNGFATRKGAEDVAMLVIAKMKKGEMPPTVTIDEMKKIKAI